MRLSIHMMVLNGASVVERALRPLATIADEVVVSDTGSTDGTPEIIQHLCDTKFPDEFGSAAKLKCRMEAVLKPEIYTNLYFKDEPASWKFDMPGPFTGQLMLGDWAAARNASLFRCQGEYVLKLDADDEILDPGNLLSALQFLEDHPGIDFLYCPYEILAQDEKCKCESPGANKTKLETISMYCRLWRNKPTIRFTQEIHEYLTGLGPGPDGRPNWFIVAQGLRFRDWRDSPGRGVRIPNRNFKVFMREYEKRVRLKMGLPPSFLLSTIGEAAEVSPNFALSLLRMAKEQNPKLATEAGYLHSLGRAYAKNCLDRHALDTLMEASKLAPSSASILLDLGFQRFSMGLPGWKDTLQSALTKAHLAGGFNVDHRELRKAVNLLDEHKE